MASTPQEILDTVEQLPFDDPVYFSIPAGGYEHPHVLLACLADQPAMHPWEDESGNMQGSVRLDLIKGVYWIIAKHGATQEDIDAAIAAYPERLAEVFPDD